MSTPAGEVLGVPELAELIVSHLEGMDLLHCLAITNPLQHRKPPWHQHIQRLLRCASIAGLADSISRPIDVYESLTLTIEAINARKGPSSIIRNTADGGLCNLLRSRSLDDSKFMFTSLVDGSPVQTIYQLERGYLRLNGDAYGQYWIGYDDDRSKVCRNLETWSLVRRFQNDGDSVWYSYGHRALHFHFGGHNAGLIQVWDSTVQQTRSFWHRGVIGHTETGDLNTLLTYSRETIRNWNLQSLDFSVEIPIQRILTVKKVGGILAIETGDLGEDNEDDVLEGLEYRYMEGKPISCTFEEVLKTKLHNHKDWSTNVNVEVGTHWCAFSDGTHLLGVDGHFSVFAPSGTEQGALTVKGIRRVEILLDRFIAAFTDDKLIIFSKGAEELITHKLSRPDEYYRLMLDIFGRFILFYPETGNIGNIVQVEVLSFVEERIHNPIGRGKDGTSSRPTRKMASSLRGFVKDNR